jgi:hypothetical protein
MAPEQSADNGITKSFILPGTGGECNTASLLVFANRRGFDNEDRAAP